MPEHLMLLLRELVHAHPKWRATKETFSVYAARLGGVSPLALEKACDDWINAGNDYAPGPGVLLANAERIDLAMRRRAQERRERVCGVRRDRLEGVVMVLLQRSVEIPDLVERGKRRPRWSKDAIAKAEAELADLKVTLEQARAALAEPPAPEPTFEQQSADVAARARKRLGLDSKGAQTA